MLLIKGVGGGVTSSFKIVTVGSETLQDVQSQKLWRALGVKTDVQSQKLVLSLRVRTGIDFSTSS